VRATAWALIRVSTDDQNLDRQENAARAWGAQHPEYNLEIVREEGVSGAAKKRPEVERVLRESRAGDALWVSELSRIGRSLTFTLSVLHALHDRGVRIVVADGQIDFGSPMGRAFAAIVAALAELERDILRERTRDGLAAARRRGVQLGKRPDRWDAEALETLRGALSAGQTPYRVWKDESVTLWRPCKDDVSGEWTEKPVKPGRSAIYAKVGELGNGGER